MQFTKPAILRALEIGMVVNIHTKDGGIYPVTGVTGDCVIVALPTRDYELIPLTVIDHLEVTR